MLLNWLVNLRHCLQRSPNLVTRGRRTAQPKLSAMVESLEPRRVMSAVAVVDDSYQVGQATMMGMGVPVVLDVLANDTTDTGSLSIVSVQSPAHGTVSIQHDPMASMYAMYNMPGMTPVPDKLVFTPPSDFSGTETITYTVSNSAGDLATGTVTLTILPVASDPGPVPPGTGASGSGTGGSAGSGATGTGTTGGTGSTGSGSTGSTGNSGTGTDAVDDNYSLQQQSMPQSTTLNVLANDNTAAGTLTIVSVQSPAHGSVSIQHDPMASMNAMYGMPSTPDAILYTPSSDFSGTEVITYTIANSAGVLSTATITLTIAPPTGSGTTGSGTTGSGTTGSGTTGSGTTGSGTTGSGDDESLTFEEQMQQLTDQIAKSQSDLEEGKASFLKGISDAHSKLKQKEQEDQKAKDDALAEAQKALDDAVSAGNDAANQATTAARDAYKAALKSRVDSANQAITSSQDQLNSSLRAVEQQYDTQHQAALDGAVASVDAATTTLQSRRDSSRAAATSQISAAEATLGATITGATDALSTVHDATKTQFDSIASQADATFGSSIDGLVSSANNSFDSIIATATSQLANLPGTYVTDFSGNSTYTNAISTADTDLDTTLTGIQTNLQTLTNAARNAFTTATQKASDDLTAAKLAADNALQTGLQNADDAEASGVQAAQDGFDGMATEAETAYKGAIKTAHDHMMTLIGQAKGVLEGVIDAATGGFKTSVAESLNTYSGWLAETFGTEETTDPDTGAVIPGSVGTFQNSLKKYAKTAYDGLQEGVEAYQTAMREADTNYVRDLKATQSAYLESYAGLNQQLQKVVNEQTNKLNLAKANAKSVYDQEVQSIWASNSTNATSDAGTMTQMSLVQGLLDGAKRAFITTVGRAELAAAQKMGSAYVTAVGAERAARATLAVGLAKVENAWNEARDGAKLALQTISEEMLHTFMEKVTIEEGSSQAALQSGYAEFETDIAKAEKTAVALQQAAQVAFQNELVNDLQAEASDDAVAQKDYEHTLEDDAQIAEQQIAGVDRAWFNSTGSLQAAWLRAQSAALTAYVTTTDTAEIALNTAESAAETVAVTAMTSAATAWQTTVDSAWRSAFNTANSSATDSDSVADVLVDFSDAVSNTALSAMSTFVSSCESYASTVLNAAISADQAEEAAFHDTTETLAVATTNTLQQIGQAVYDEEQSEADAVHSASGAISDALQSYAASELSAAGSKLHSVVNALSSYGAGAMTTAVDFFTGNLKDQLTQMGAGLSSAVGFTTLTINAMSKNLTKANGIENAALAARNRRTEENLKSVMEAQAGIASQSAADRVAKSLEMMKANLDRLLKNTNDMNQLSVDQSTIVAGSPIMLVGDPSAITDGERFSPRPDATADEVAAAFETQMTIGDAAQTAQALRTWGIQTSAMEMMLSSADYATQGWRIANDEGIKLANGTNTVLQRIAGENEAAEPITPEPPEPPARPKNDDPVQDGSITTGFVYYDSIGRAWVKRLLTNPSNPNDQTWYFRPLNEVTANQGQDWTESDWNAFFASGDRGSPATDRVASDYKGGALESSFWAGVGGAGSGLKTTGKAMVNATSDTVAGLLTLGFCSGYKLEVTDADEGYQAAYLASRIGTELVLGFGIGKAATLPGKVGKAFFAWDMAGNVSTAGQGVADVAANGLTVSNTLQMVAGGFGAYGNIGGLRSAAKASSQTAKQTANAAEEVADAGKNAAKEAAESTAKNFEKANDSIKVLNSNCFAAGTPLLTPDGSKPIEEFVPGDLLLSRDEHDPNAPVVARRVEKVFERTGLIAELQVNGRTIVTTGEHPFYVAGHGWKKMSDLQVGDLLVSRDNEEMPVERILLTNSTAAVYNLCVNEDHTYFVGSEEWGFNVWTHNTDYSVNTTPVNGKYQVLDANKKVVGEFENVADAQTAAKKFNDDAKVAEAAKANAPNRTLGERIAARAAEGYPLGRCRDCADNIAKKLDDADEAYTKILVEPSVPFDEAVESFGRGFPLDPRLSEINSARNGMIGNWHEAVLKGRYIFDNLNPNGVLPLNWIFDLSSKGKLRIKTN